MQAGKEVKTMADRPSIQPGLCAKVLKWTKQKEAAFGVNLFAGKEFDVKFVAIMINLVWGVRIDIAWR